MKDQEITRRRFVRDGSLAATALAAGLGNTRTIRAGEADAEEARKIRSFNEQMEYRRCGRTNFMVSAVALGGHWKRLTNVIGGDESAGWMTQQIGRADFQENRYEVLTQCIQRGINYVDACCREEILAYAKAIQGRRDQIYFGYSWHLREPRYPDWRGTEKLKQGLEEGMKEAGLDYVDLWRISLNVESSKHTEAEIEQAVAALQWAKASGLARLVGFSSHDRRHLKKLVETYGDQIDVILTPYTAKTKLIDDEKGLWAAIKRADVGWLGIKPFASNSLFQGDSSPKSPTFEQDNRIARKALRYILCNPAITAPIPGLLTPQQVDNACLAVAERRELDLQEQADLGRAMDRAWAALPDDYQWLKDWEYV